LKVDLVNSAFASLLGLSEEILQSTVYWDLFKVFNENGGRILASDFPAAIVKRTSEPVYGFTMGIDTGNERVWVIVDSIPVFHEDGTLRQIVSTFTDITEKIRSAEKEKEISTRLVLATSAAHLGIWDLDLETRASVWSDYMFEIFGVAKDENRDNHATWWQSIHPADLEKADADIKLALTTGDYNSEYRIVRPDGTIRISRIVKTRGIVYCWIL
jgi:PAS domain-containing protein